MSKYTPGEWKCFPLYPISATSGGVVTVHPEMGLSNYGIRAVFHDEHGRRCTVQVAHAHITIAREGEAEANARLIAAAPDMLDALKSVDRQTFCDCLQPDGSQIENERTHHEPDCWAPKLRDAIAKAEDQS